MKYLNVFNVVGMLSLLRLGYEIKKRLHQPRIIIVAGMCQSGSTLLFNLIRFILESKNNKVYSCHYSNFDYLQACDSDYTIIKTHKHHIKLHTMADFIFVTQRDLRDTICSAKRRWPKLFNTPQKLVNRGHHNISVYNDWKDYANFDFIYEKYMKEPNKMIERIGRILNIKDVDSIAVKNKTDGLFEMKIPERDDFDDSVYSKTLLSKHHNTSGGKSGLYKIDLTIEEIDAIEDEHMDWIANYYRKNRL